MTATGIFDRVVPKKNAFLMRDKQGDVQHGCGAWQIAARYDFLNLNDKGINGGYLSDWTLGLNWFLRSKRQIQWNHGLTNRESPDGDRNGLIQGLGMRVAFDL